MNEIIELKDKDYKVIFDLDAYKIAFLHEIPIDIWEEFQNSRQYKLLYEILTSKFSLAQGLKDADFAK